MADLFDDGLDEYAEQQENTPTVLPSVPTVTPQQQKSAELAEIEQSLEVLKGIKVVQGEMRKTMSELTGMREEVKSISDNLSNDVKTAKSIWDDLLKNYAKDLVIDEESFAKFDGIMQAHSDKILSKTCKNIENVITKNVTGQLTELITNKINELNSDMKASEDAHRKVLENLEKEYRDSITNLKQNHGKLFSQADKEQTRIFMPKVTFWVLAAASMIIIACGIINWINFWKTNDKALDYMLFAIAGEVIYGIWLGLQWFNNRGEDENKKKNKTGGFSVSLPKALYVMILTLSSTVYFVWGYMDVVGSPNYCFTSYR